MHFLWIDCEMSGLDYLKDEILEVACILTDVELKVIFQYECVFYHDEKFLQQMSDWCLNQHKKSGLFNRVLESKYTFQEADNAIRNLLEKYSTEKGVYLAGNSVYVDTLFLQKSFPKIISWVHYRLLDVSTLKIIAEKKGISKFYKKELHTALADINESIEEYKYYESCLLKL
jgi:oligoribonuclease